MMIGIIKQSSISSRQSTVNSLQPLPHWFKSWRWPVRWQTWTLVFPIGSSLGNGLCVGRLGPWFSFLQSSILYKK